MNAGPTPPASKKDALLALLDRGLVMIHVDARREGVAVPDHLVHEYHLRLNLSYRFDLPDLEIDDWGVRATLSFRGLGFRCQIPWPSIFAMTQPPGERGWLWPGDLAPELLDAITGEEAPQAPPKLVAVPPPEGGAAEPDPPSDEPSPPRRPHLRLVK
jgi:stringent starvation protein B